jgi:hypothetical protein
MGHDAESFQLEMFIRFLWKPGREKNFLDMKLTELVVTVAGG